MDECVRLLPDFNKNCKGPYGCSYRLKLMENHSFLLYLYLNSNPFIHCPFMDIHTGILEEWSTYLCHERSLKLDADWTS